MKISHIKKEGNNWICQSNEEHSVNVSKLVETFTSEFNCQSLGKAIGLLHDLGKNSNAFQRYICGNSGYKKEYVTAPPAPHAYVGAVAAKTAYPSLYPIISHCIMGHHAGLYDQATLDGKMNDPLPKEIQIPFNGNLKMTFPNHLMKSDVHLLIRMLFSSLVDADYLDTEAFMDNEKAALRNTSASLAELLPLLEAKLAAMKANAPATKVNQVREEVQKACLNASIHLPGFFSLTVPTGGGKTLSSLLWAMHHAVKHQKRRIIIAIPYTSIIVQTAAILRQIFGDENVLEHHSNVDYDYLCQTDSGRKMKLISENWDAPIVVTTNVQLFESLFSNRPSKCRKLHNLSQSILILDEVQSLPLDYFTPILDSLRTLQRVFGVSVLFTTASQPLIKGNIRFGKKPNDVLYGIEDIHEIIDSPEKLSKQLRRAQISFETQPQSYDEIAEQIAAHPRALCIVNTRRDAKEIYSRLPQNGLIYHLSRMMCPAHIRHTIDEIKAKLNSDDAPVIRVIATQLIEAGVDIDFPVVFRQEAGLDSIIQAAGRCNREGKSSMGKTYVFKFPQRLPSGTLSFAASSMNQLDPSSDWFAPDTMKAYFMQLYSKIQTFDKADIGRLLYTKDLCFQTAAKVFHLIKDEGFGVIVNYGNSLSLIEQLKDEGPSYGLMKRLGQYTVGLHERDFKALRKGGLIEEIITGVYLLSGREQYDTKVGIVLENHWLEEILIK